MMIFIQVEQIQVLNSGLPKGTAEVSDLYAWGIVMSFEELKNKYDILTNIFMNIFRFVVLCSPNSKIIWIYLLYLH